MVVVVGNALVQNFERCTRWTIRTAHAPPGDGPRHGQNWLLVNLWHRFADARKGKPSYLSQCVGIGSDGRALGIHFVETCGCGGAGVAVRRPETHSHKKSARVYNKTRAKSACK